MTDVTNDVSLLNGYVFDDATPPDDIAPPTADVEFPCRVCNKEAGPWGGRGRKPTLCAEHKKGSRKGPAKVTGSASSLAAQAANVLEQVNGIVAIAAMATGFAGTASAIAAANGEFREQAYMALTTDPELCRLILKVGAKSSKMSLGMAYLGLGMAVAPVAVMEFKAKREAKLEADAARAED